MAVAASEDDDDRFSTASESSSCSSVGEQNSIESPKNQEPGNPLRKKALLELRCRVEDAVLGNYILGRSTEINDQLNLFPAREDQSKAIPALREISLWGVPLLPSRGHSGTDIVLLKFLRANDFKALDAFEMLQKTLIWRKQFKPDSIVHEDIGGDLETPMFFNGGTDREGHPLCFNVYGALNNKGLLRSETSGSKEKREMFLKLMIQGMEKSTERLNFRAGEPSSVVLITDLKNAGKTKELRAASKKALLLIHEHYPELIHRNIIINAPFWYYTFHALASRFKSQRTRSKFIFARPNRVTKTLLKYVAPEDIPVQYGGLKRDKEDEFLRTDKVSELILKGSASLTIKIPISEPGVTAVWDVAVVGSEAGYQEEFVPDDECSYTISLKKEKKLSRKSVRNSFYIGEPGNVVITITNDTFKRKKVFYRFKTKPTLPMYVFLKQ